MQDEAMDVARSAPQGAHYRADVSHCCCELLSKMSDVPFLHSIIGINFLIVQSQIFLNSSCISTSVTIGSACILKKRSQYGIAVESLT